MGQKKMTQIKDIVNDVYNNIDEETKKKLSELEPDFLGGYSQLHFGLGTHIRNKYCLWDFGNADDISMIVINRLIKKIKNKKNT